MSVKEACLIIQDKARQAVKAPEQTTEHGYDGRRHFPEKFLIYHSYLFYKAKRELITTGTLNSVNEMYTEILDILADHNPG